MTNIENTKEISLTPDRPAALYISIHTGMLKTMGHNMYTSLAKCLAEFVANAYDADSHTVEIKIPFERISEARNQLRAKAKQEYKEGKRDDASAVYDSLPADIKIEIRDDGHGMSAQELNSHFLLITRNRREDGSGKTLNSKSESGKRWVMGRKGIGKLAGFGAAEHICVESKRKGSTYATRFEMDYEKIQLAESLGKAEFVPEYIENLPIDQSYTLITLSNLRCDCLKSSEETIRGTLARTFCILDTDFTIKLNSGIVEDIPIDYEFCYPSSINLNEYATSAVKVDDDYQFDIQYIIKFRARADDSDATGDKKSKRNSLPAGRRGARIYSNGRLTHGPSLLHLHSGVHNFHAQDYMECIVIADELDRLANDYIVTSRSDLQTGSPIVDGLFFHVTQLMKEALSEHYKFRDKKAGEEIEKDVFSQSHLEPLKSLSTKTQRAAKEVLKSLASVHGVKSSSYQEMAPLMLQAANAGEVITRLIQLETNPKSLQVISHSMAELSRMEKNDVLKLFRTRQRAINALETLHNDSFNITRNKGYENELHSLLKQNPWLIR